jgi:asparagine synthase (glutamine-hydrolysing)
MCGVAGAFQLCGGPTASLGDTVRRINDYQRRRGPDGEGIWSSTDSRVVLGHRRLSIIDTSLAGAQPMQDATERWTITYNGELYNYRLKAAAEDF